MFTDNRFIANDLNDDHRGNQYHLLYYQFIKRAFGLQYVISDKPVDIEVFFDKLPDNEVKNDKFKSFIHGIQFLPDFANTSIVIKKEAIYEVDSKKHILMQCLDVVLGSIAFRLNDHHKEIPPGKKRRGKRTVAKEALYKHINKLIRLTRPNFNIGISTGLGDSEENIFYHSYRHWLFIPKTKNKTYINSKK